MPRSGVAACVILVGVAWSGAWAREIWSSEDGEKALSLTTAIKATTLSPESEPASSLWRLRFTLEGRLREVCDIEVGYEQRTLSAPAGSGGLDIIPVEVEAPYRISPLDDVLVDEPGYAHRHELDRALAAFHTERAELTIGRQAIGWGRGVRFGAVDLFAPFTPLEVDREWRRGVDALRADIRLSDTYSLDIVGAFGEDWDESACVARFRGYTGTVDSELILGKRRRDAVYGGSMSAAVGDAEVHTEVAFFDTPEDIDDGVFGKDDPVAKLVVGASYTFDVGNGLTIWAEYHFSGFGFRDMAEATDLLSELSPNYDPDRADRFARGDSQILGRNALAIQASYELNDSWALNLVWIGSPGDGSGVVAPVFSWNLADNVSIVASLYAPYGRGLDAAGAPQSEYGASPATAFVQIRIYD